MTIEEANKRNEFADKCEQLAEFAKTVPEGGGWDTPMDFIARSLRSWAHCYRTKTPKANV